MPRQVVQLGIFVSCPSNLNGYREKIAKMVHENRKTWSDAFGVEVLLLDSRDASSGVSLDGPQDLINKAMAEKYDIYLGLMGPRFGSETRAFGSGTEEEYYVALNGFLERGDPFRVVFGFCRTPVDPFDMNLAQLQRVLDFRKSLSGHQLYFEWANENQFRKAVRFQIESSIKSYVSDPKTAILGGGRYT